jgi:hypothetical protein
MLWYVLSVLLCPMYVLVGRLLGDDRDRLILALRQQVLILQRRLGKRPSLARSERLALVLACARMSRRRLDDKFTAHADALLVADDTDVVRLPARSPDLNGHIERCIRTLREECLDRIIILNERHLRWVSDQFARYYNHRRPHRSLQLHVPQGPRDYPRQGLIACRQVLGGLVNDYYRKAA